MLNLIGYQETELLYSGSRTLVYRALRHSDQQPVILKVLGNPHPTFNELVQFRNQYRITRNLESPFIVKPLALERHGNGYALVMPDHGALPLTQYWQDSQQTLQEWLTIASQLATALHILAQQQIIHKDIKPANILIQPQTQQIQLIDFSLASLLPKEQRSLINPNVLEGTLAYLSPEQTGRMNRGIDYRSDFYALGVTLYELLTGWLPFSREEPLALIHCHIAQAPIAPVDLLDVRGHAYPAMLSAIIMKLMAKNAEDRYQTALGLKHDLARCLQSLEQTGAIADFELAERDLCDRFNIPEKLYGREADVQKLLDAFVRISSPPSEFKIPNSKRPNAELLLVAGFSGIGKTALINEVHKPIVEKRGYFIKGKFEQLNRNIPFSAFVQAFRSLMGQILSESDAELQAWKHKILEAVGENGQVLIAVIPELERVIGEQPPLPELSGIAAQNRFNRFLEKFIALFASPEHPLVIFLDDLQWADSASLNLIRVLMGETRASYLLLLGAYRDNEVSPAHPLLLTLAELAKQNTPISTLTLSPLSIADANQLIAETLSCPTELAEPLTNLIYQQTKGNPFFTNQLLKGLNEDGLIVLNQNLGYWECDLVAVRAATLTDDVVEFMSRRLHKFSAATQNILKSAACIGNQFDLATLAMICETPIEDVATNLWSALREGLILPQSEAYKFFQEQEKYEEKSADIVVGYHFLHDRVQQAAYALIPEVEKKVKHLRIGQTLLRESHENNRDGSLFDIVNHLNQGVGLVREASQQQQLAQLNFKAGKNAKEAMAYTEAVSYFERGIELLGDHGWDSPYQLMLDLYSALAEVQFLNGDFEAVDRIFTIALVQIQDTADALPLYIAQISSDLAQGKMLASFELGLQVLASLGVQIPRSSSEVAVQQKLKQIQTAFKTQTIQSFIELPQNHDPQFLRIQDLLTVMTGFAYKSNPDLLPLLVSEQVSLLMHQGNIPAAASIYATYGMLFCGSGNFELGFFAAKVALALQKTFPAKQFEMRLRNLIYSYINPWRTPLRASLEPLQQGFSLGLEAGDIEYTAYGILHYAQFLYFSGIELATVDCEIATYSQILATYRQEGLLQGAQVFHQTVLNLIHHHDLPWQLEGQVFQESQHLADWRANRLDYLIAALHINKLVLSVLFDNPGVGLEYATVAHQSYGGLTGEFQIAYLHCYRALAHLATLEPLTAAERIDCLEQVAIDLEVIERFADAAPMNFQHQVDLIRAERYRVVNQKLEAIECYDRAIAGAKANEYRQEEALANELAAKFYLGWDRETIAATYMQEAYYCYAHWGAKAKTKHLEANYPQLLAPILQKQQVEFNTLESLSRLTKTLTATVQNQTQSSINLANALDVVSILQAAQKRSSTIAIEQLLAEIAEIILTNTGAQKMVLLTPEGQQWQLQASAERVEDGNIVIQTQAQPLTAESPVPIHLIQYVKNTQESVLMGTTQTKIPGILKGYLLKHQPQSVLCVPLLSQGHLVAIAYLEHPTIKGLFTPDRRTIIEFLCAQAATAIQNVQLSHQAQQAQNNAEQAFAELQERFALGHLMTGFVHEMNDSVGGLHENIQLAQDAVQSLLGWIDIDQAQDPQAYTAVEDELKGIDLALMHETLPKRMASIQAGIDRICNISDSLRIFSSQVQDHKILFNLHEGLERTLLFLKHRTQANRQRPPIEVVKQYGTLPKVRCFPGQLNQVFMTILVNAINAFDGMNQGRTYAEIEAKSNVITIQTTLVDTQVKIQIQDNGSGMKPEIIEQIFKPEFTTKVMSKEVGLGMAIAHQIVTEKHRGSIVCHSELGKGTAFIISLPLG
ncbi:MAG: AAA family ATPase [Cyanobacteria bacterium P01_G01_bin.54]